MTKEHNPALVADIGGTNARFALADMNAADTPLRGERVYRTADFPDLPAAMEAFFHDSGLGKPPEAAVLAVAGPVWDDRIDLTNREWSFSVAGLRTRFRFRHLRVLNDFAAIAHSLPGLKKSDLHHIGGPQTEEAAPVLAVVGPGTGLGVGGLLCKASSFHVIASEGGHIGFAPADAAEFEIRCVLEARMGRISCERLLSGPGLVNLYRAMAEIDGSTAGNFTPAEIVECGITGTDPLCHAVLQRYCAILGSFAGDVALMFRAGRLFLGGGILPRFPEFLAQSAFRTRFEDKGRFAAMMRRTPVDVIIRPEPGLLGAARALREVLAPPG